MANTKMVHAAYYASGSDVVLALWDDADARDWDYEVVKTYSDDVKRAGKYRPFHPSKIGDVIADIHKRPDVDRVTVRDERVNVAAHRRDDSDLSTGCRDMLRKAIAEITRDVGRPGASR